MAEKIKLELTRGEANHLWLLLVDNEREGSYYLNCGNWEKQTKSLKNKLSKALD